VTTPCAAARAVHGARRAVARAGEPALRAHATAPNGGGRGGAAGQVVDPAPVTRKRGPPGAHEATVAKCVAVSACGNFGVVGYACGRIDRYNMQSGAHRGTYWAPPPAGHASAVLGVGLDGLGEMVVSGGFDGSVKLWDADSRKLLHSFDVGAPVGQICVAPDSPLVCPACSPLARLSLLSRPFPLPSLFPLPLLSPPPSSFSLSSPPILPLEGLRRGQGGKGCGGGRAGAARARPPP
jgi:hypothetical protein